MSFFAELKRRNVFQVAIAYIVIAWLVMQVADVILNNIAAPGWVFQVILLLLGIGFLFAMFFAWEFELTPEGLKREHEVNRSQSITHVTGRKLDFTIIAVLVLALGYFAYDKLVLSTARETAAIESALEEVTSQAAAEQGASVEVSTESDRSIAVLPFVNISDDPSNEYFSDGITEEIINALVKIPGLSVPARTSVFAFKGESRDVRGIGRELNVAHVLEGSIRSQNNQIRITAQLIKVDDGFHLWSETFDRELNDIFKVQEEIAASISEVLMGELGLGASAVPNQTLDMEAYDFYLQGRALLRARARGTDRLSLSISLFEAATQSDPEFAPAWAAMAIAYQVADFFQDLGVSSQDKAIEIAKHALTLDPDNVDALDAMASALRDTWQWAEAEKVFKKAMAIDPESSELLEDYAEFLGTVGRLDEYLKIAEKGYAIDPKLEPMIGSYVTALIANHRNSEAFEPINQRTAQSGFSASERVLVLLSNGDVAGVIKYLDEIVSLEPELAPALSAFLENPTDNEARDNLRQLHSSDATKSYWGSNLYSDLVLAQNGDAEFVLNTELARRKRTGWGNMEGFWTPLYAPVRQLPRFEEFLYIVKLPQYWDEAGWPEMCHQNDDERIICQ